MYIFVARWYQKRREDEIHTMVEATYDHVIQELEREKDTYYDSSLNIVDVD